MSLEEFEIKMLLLGFTKVTFDLQSDRGKQIGWKVTDNHGQCKCIVSGFDMWEKLHVRFAGNRKDCVAVSVSRAFDAVEKYLNTLPKP